VPPVETRKAGPGIDYMLPDGDIPRTGILTGTAQQAPGKNILKFSTRMLRKRCPEQMEFSAGSQRFPGGYPVYGTDNRAASALGAVL